MARAIELIERDILALEETTRAIAADLQSAYASYLTTLGQALRQQLILATYHLCTQGYAEKFLSLSLNQRQELQQAIRKLGKQASEQLLAYTTNKEEDKRDEGDQGDEQINLFPPVPPTTFPSPPTAFPSPPTTFPSPPTSSTPPSLPTPPTPPISPTPSPSSSPIALAIWQQNQERMTQETLKKVSRKANVLLQKAGILPIKLPEPILEAAAAASEASAEVMPGPPNLLNLVIEIENGSPSEDSSLTQIMTVNLRLGEIEFADATLSSKRKQIRNILVQLNKQGQEYQKKQRERSIAEAEAAWRASWFDD